MQLFVIHFPNPSFQIKLVARHCSQVLGVFCLQRQLLRICIKASKGVNKLKKVEVLGKFVRQFRCDVNTTFSC
jgi:hypothetical protein